MKGLYHHLGGESFGHSILKMVKDLPKGVKPDKGLFKRAADLDKFYIPTRYPNGFDWGAPIRVNLTISRSPNSKNFMYRSHHNFLISTLIRLRLRKEQKRTICPSCHGDHTERVNQIDDGEGYWKKEEYLCDDCDCEWDWTYQRPFFRWRVKIRAPGWMKIE